MSLTTFDFGVCIQDNNEAISGFSSSLATV